MRVLQGWGAGDGGRGGGEVPPRGLVSGHGAAVRSPALGQKRSSMIFFFTSVFASVRASARTERVRSGFNCRPSGKQAPWTVGHGLIFSLSYISF
jgi:hypothetical protein